MQNNITKIIQLMCIKYKLCNEMANIIFLKNLINCENITCLNCPLYGNNSLINIKYGDCNDQSV